MKRKERRRCIQSLVRYLTASYFFANVSSNYGSVVSVWADQMGASCYGPAVHSHTDVDNWMSLLALHSQIDELTQLRQARRVLISMPRETRDLLIVSLTESIAHKPRKVLAVSGEVFDLTAIVCMRRNIDPHHLTSWVKNNKRQYRAELERAQSDLRSAIDVYVIMCAEEEE